MTRRLLLAATASAAVLLGACGGAALPSDPQAAVAQGLEAVHDAGFAWELVLDTAPNPDAPQPANALAVGARGLELSGVALPDGSGSFEVGYPGVGTLETINVVDGDDVTSYLRVVVPALPPDALDMAEQELAGAPPQVADELALLLDVAREATSGDWVAFRGDLQQLGAVGRGLALPDGTVLADPLGEDRDQLVALIEEKLAEDPTAPEVDVPGLLDDVEATFGTSLDGFMDRYVPMTDVPLVGAEDGRAVALELAVRALVLDAMDVVERNVALEPDELAELEEGRAEVASEAPVAVGGVRATLDDRYVTSLTFDLETFVASLDLTEGDAVALPSVTATVRFDDIGTVTAPAAPEAVVATYDVEELMAAFEALQALAGPMGGMALQGA